MVRSTADSSVSTATIDDLHSVIMPASLRKWSRIRIPWTREHAATGKELLSAQYSENPDLVDAIKVAWPVLKALSEFYGPGRIPDMMKFLPNPEEPEFPEQVLGMLALLDQAPKVLFQGSDERWTSWFDQIDRKFYEQLHALDRAQGPWDRRQRAEATPEVAKRPKEEIIPKRWTSPGESTHAGEPRVVVSEVVEGSGSGEDIVSETSLQITVRLGDPGREILEWPLDDPPNCGGPQTET